MDFNSDKQVGRTRVNFVSDSKKNKNKKNKNKKSYRAFVAGLTFKENVSDLRNSKVFDIYKFLSINNFDIKVHDLTYCRCQRYPPLPAMSTDKYKRHS